MHTMGLFFSCKNDVKISTNWNVIRLWWFPFPSSGTDIRSVNIQRVGSLILDNQSMGCCGIAQKVIYPQERRRDGSLVKNNSFKALLCWVAM